MKVYGSTEWLAGRKKKYRRVFDTSETTFIYVELSLYNKQYDQVDWRLKVNFKVFALKGEEREQLANLHVDHFVQKSENIIYVREGWGDKRQSFYWKKGVYLWEAYIKNKLVSSTKFYIENSGQITATENPYFKIESLKLFEGSDKSKPMEERVYYKRFDGKDTRFVFMEFNCQNLVENQDWVAEMYFNFYNNARQLKGETVELKKIQKGTKSITITSGWGSETRGTWYPDKYTVEVIFMGKLMAILPFEISDSYEEGLNEAYLPEMGTAGRKRKLDQLKSFDEVMTEMDELIGLQTIKTKIKEYADYLNFLRIRTERGFEDPKNIDLHAVFTGNPGTGKTTVAKLLGKIYFHLGLLSKGHVHEVDRADLVGEYIGQTAPKVKAAINKARGGVLFIDEAYSLARAKDDPKDFGREVIEILIKEMSDGEGDLAVIVAGYPAEIKTFIESNPGMQSRFTHRFDFPDYTPQELKEISEFAAEKQHVGLTAQGKAALYDKIVDSYRNRDRFFGNARFVFQLVKEAKINLGIRVMKTENPRDLSDDELSLITVPDIEKIFTKKKKERPDIPIDEELLKIGVGKLNSLIGLSKVKQDIKELIELVRYYKEHNLEEELDKLSLHFIFAGPPGTGKTTVARILSDIFKALGVLERGHLVECDRESLVAGFVGQTALKTATKVDEATGGMLFIDEAYALAQRGNNDFGQEAIETLLKRMEDQKGEFAVIVAGYAKNMKMFLEANPGLKSRFDKVLNFQEFSLQELDEIAQLLFKENGYKLQAKAKKHITKAIDEIAFASNKQFFGNGRMIRTLVDVIIKKQNLRLAQSDDPKKSEKASARTILVEDIKSAAAAFKQEQEIDLSHLDQQYLKLK